jgi:hypothetical protein
MCRLTRKQDPDKTDDDSEVLAPLPMHNSSAVQPRALRQNTCCQAGVGSAADRLALQECNTDRGDMALLTEPF